MKYPRNNLVLFSEDASGVLSNKCTEVTVFDSKLEEFTRYMFDVAKQHKGIGLSAPQVGISKQIFVIIIGHYEEVFINPSFSPTNKNSKNKIISTEGCLSFGDTFKSIKRWDEIKVSYKSLKNKPMSLVLSDLASVCFQHEFDHLQGVHFGSTTAAK